MAELILGTDTLNGGRVKINNAITQAEQALNTANESMNNYESVANVANQALTNSESTQAQLNSVVVTGDSSVEAAQARVNKTGLITYSTLKERLDTEIQTINVKDFGAKGDKTTDDTQSFLDAIAHIKSLGGGILFLPKGIFLISSTLTIDFPLSISGCGSDYTNLDISPKLTNSVSALLWNGAADETFIEITGRVGALNWHDFVIDGGRITSNVSKACGIGLDIDRLVGSSMSNIAILNCKTNCLKILPRATSGAHDNAMHNVFQGIQLARADTPLYLGGNDHGNSCHNNFSNLVCDYYVTGTYFGDTDNNTFWMYRTYPRSGSGYGIIFDNNARSNYFYHCQTNGCHATGNSKNIIFGYDRENGQARPTVDEGAKLFWTEAGNNAFYWNLTELMTNLAQYIEGEGVDWGSSPSKSCFKMLRPANGQGFAIDMSNDGRTVNFWCNNGTGTANKVLGLNALGIDYFKIMNSGTSETVKFLSSMPTTGTFNINDLIININRTESGSAGAKYVVFGWTRLTTGSNHVLNTDWLEMRMATGR